MGFLEALSQIDKVIDPAGLESSLEDGLSNVLFDMLNDFESTTSSWNTQPDFRIVDPHEEADGLVGAVGTDDEIYGYVTRGTRPHPIEPKVAKFLRFQGGFTAKTQPGLMGSSSGGPTGDFVYAQHVDHPGTQARGYEDMISEKYGPILADEVQRRIDRYTGG